LAAFSRNCGVSVTTQQNWQRTAQASEISGFEAIDRSDVEAWGGMVSFRMGGIDTSEYT